MFMNRNQNTSMLGIDAIGWIGIANIMENFSNYFLHIYFGMIVTSPATITKPVVVKDSTAT
jgi:hypothetical protein